MIATDRNMAYFGYLVKFDQDEPAYSSRDHSLDGETLEKDTSFLIRQHFVAYHSGLS